VPGLLKTTLEQIGGIWRRLGAPSRVAVVTTLLLAIGGLLAVSLWARSPSYVILESGLDTGRASRIVDALQDLGVEYQTRDRSTTILVPSQDLSRARLKLAGQGLIVAGDPPEEEKDSPFLPPEERRARQVRALSQEIARAIQGLEGIERAKVLLSPGRESPFSRTSRPPTCSIIVQPESGRTIASWQVEGIVRTATNAVTGLTAENVSVVSGDGRPLTKAANRMGAAVSDDALLEREMDLEDKVRKILDGIVGPGRFRIGITLLMNFDVTKRRTTEYDEAKKVLERETSKKTSTPTPEAAGGTPGAGSDSALAGPVSPPAKTEDRERTYKVPMTEVEEVKSTPQIVRITAGITIDKDALDETAKAGLEGVLKSALGIDETRGDSLTLDVMDFAEIEMPPDVAPGGRLDLSQILDIAQYAAAGLAGLGLLLFFRGAFRGRKKGEAPARTGTRLDLTVGDEPAEEEAISPKRLERQRIKHEIARAIDRDPRGVAKLIEMWLHEEGA
jgi:flagellar M-ring protein FliF